MRADTLTAARQYVRLGWCLIPLRAAKKRPAVRWKRYQSAAPSASTLARWFGEDGHHVAVVFGEPSGGLASRDFDDLAAYERWAARFPELAAELPTVETRRGRHVYFVLERAEEARVRRAIGKPDGRGAIALGDGELRLGAGCYSVLPPSVHPSGHRYRWLLDPLEKPPAVVGLVEAGFIDPPHATESHRGVQRTTEAIEGVVKVVVSGGDRAVAETTLDSLPGEVREAIESTLPTGPGRRHRQVFELARALKAIPWLAEAAAGDLKEYVRAWHERARPNITTEPFDETWIDLLKAWPRVKFPKGTEPMTQRLAEALAQDLPAAAERFDSVPVRGLVALCRELQRGAGDGPFFLGCRTVGRLFQVDHTTAWRWLYLLTAEGVLDVIERGSQASKRASRFRYLGDL